MFSFSYVILARLPFFCNPGYCIGAGPEEIRGFTSGTMTCSFWKRGWLGYISCCKTESTMELEKWTPILYWIMSQDKSYLLDWSQDGKQSEEGKYVLGQREFGTGKEATAINSSGGLEVARSSEQHPYVKLFSQKAYNYRKAWESLLRGVQL